MALIMAPATLSTATPAAPAPAGLREAVLIPTPQMHCQSCENKIKKNMRFEKGVKRIETDLETQHVTITYDGRKTNVKALQEGMKKIGYETRVVSDQPVKKKQ
ncbi:MAG: heavy-metal-associated domain-containing protein [Bacteroidales bacterium]|nr:heavy-metal-associated domain-containing protein [Bacteroidales bacterium]